MPRRKTVRAAKRITPRAYAEQVGENLTGESKAAKLEVLLKDFDQEVEARIQELSSFFKDLLIDVEKMYMIEQHKLPKGILNKKYAEFCASGGWPNMETFEDLHLDLVDLLKPVSARTRTERKGKIPQHMDTIAEDSQNIGSYAKMRLKVPKTGAGSRKSKKVSEMLVNHGPPRAGWDTPLQTPAFSARLPQTPAMTKSIVRKMIPGESLFLISANGSPVQLEGGHVVFGRDETNARVDSVCVLNQDAGN